MTEPPAEPERRPASARSSNARSLLALRARLGHSLADLTAGGAWTYQLTPAIRRSLRWFWFDGLFAAACDTAPAAYLSLFVLALGGTRGQIGLTSSLSSLSAALFLMPSAMLVERWGHHKRIVVTASLVSRVSLLLMALLPWFLHGSPAIAALIALAVVYGTFANISVPAWTPLTAHLVPLQWRGRYFSSRNIAMVVSAMSLGGGVGAFSTMSRTIRYFASLRSLPTRTTFLPSRFLRASVTGALLSLVPATLTR